MIIKMLTKSKLLIVAGMLFLMFWSVSAVAQNYPNILNYALNGTPVHGVKIKTNIPFIPGNQMPTIQLSGYSYGAAQVFDVKLVYYIYSNPVDFFNPVNYHFYAVKASSAGGLTPGIYLSHENGKVIIYIDSKIYYQRFTVSAFAEGMGENATWFQGWTTADEPNSGSHMIEVGYENTFAGKVNLPGSGIWNQYGNVGIGTTNPTEKLSVNGKIRAQEIKIEVNNWPDFVFEQDYKLLKLTELDKFIKINKHLPDIPPARTIGKDGLAIGEMNKILLQKVEELTIHLIEKDKLISTLIKRMDIVEKSIKKNKNKSKHE
ncbi:hypothetical protein QWY86_15605 [Pedobacter aquatilis]|uniref:hypothetical protein n=1 Tax=Pedobacter aquatilis TaxID=351343 RepID=UPI0025B48ECC|nr:hypothetical protein [Pedobacter aquatilis]MDN3588109.1 hypothetical protein [Pedobacter aquatilis]